MSDRKCWRERKPWSWSSQDKQWRDDSREWDGWNSAGETGWKEARDASCDCSRDCHDPAMLLIRNLPSEVRAKKLKKLFSKFGKVLSVQVMMADGRACAFIKYLLRCEATLARKDLHGYQLEPGWPLVMKVDAPGVFLSNIPDETPDKYLHYVFSFYGKIENIYMAREDSTRSAFIEYTTAREAELAMEVMKELRTFPAKTQKSQDYTEDLQTLLEPPGAEEHIAPDTCVVCMTDAKSHAFTPCGHMCVCSDCAATLMAQDDPICPICRGEAQQALQIFS